MLSYPCVPYENFVKYAIFVCKDNETVNKFLQEQEMPTIEDKYLDLRRKQMISEVPDDCRKVKTYLKRGFVLPKTKGGFQSMLKWLVSTRLIFPFVYFNPAYLEYQTGIEVKAVKEVFLLLYHPYLRRVHNCSVLAAANNKIEEFVKFFPNRCSAAGFEWYRFIFFNPDMMESEGDWLYYFGRMHPVEAKLYDAARKGETNYVIWMLGGLPKVSMQDLQDNIQSVAFWKMMEKFRGDLIGSELGERDSDDGRRWTRMGIEALKATPKALPAPSEINQSIFEQATSEADVLDNEDPQQSIPIYQKEIEPTKN